MKEAFEIICKNPSGFQIRYDDNRIYFTKIFPYGIHYQYIAKKNEVRIKAVFHTTRNPQIWEQQIFFNKNNQKRVNQLNKKVNTLFKKK